MPLAHAVRFHRFGPPADVAHLESIEIGEPGPGEVVVRMVCAPIHPADLNRLEGRYGEKPELPATGGIEGFGTIESGDGEAAGLRAGQPVALSQTTGTWSERIRVPVDRVVPLPQDLAPDLAATLVINPATAWRMLHDFVPLAEGDWVLLNAANSAVGRAVIRIARSKGWRPLAVVRRPELVPELLDLGASAVLLDDDQMRVAIPEITGGAEVRLALNAVGGASALRLANALAPGGTMVTYGAMSRRPLELPNGLLIFKDLHIRGFWLTRWFRQAGAAARGAMFHELIQLATKGVLKAGIAAEFPLSQAAAALTAASTDRRTGKVVFRMRPAESI
jgi:trans-2-enoyl-CoA reductase